MHFCRNITIGVSRGYFQFIKDFYQDSSGNQLLEPIDGDFVHTPVNMYFKKVTLLVQQVHCDNR